MDLSKETKEAFKKAIDRAGGRLVRLQEKTGVNYSVINRLNSGKNKFKDMSLQTLEKLFPELLIYFFKDEYPPEKPTESNLTVAERKLLKLIHDLDEEDQLDLLMEAAAIRERRSKNKQARTSHKVPKAG